MIEDMFTKLAAPFEVEAISWRLGAKNKEATKGIALAYLDARDVMDRLDMVCGPGGWQCRYSHANGKTVCDIGVRVDRVTDFEWVWKADGAGDTDVEAEKGALSDAFKRAAVRWGIGRYLYGLGNTWVKIEPAGRSHKIVEGEYASLRKALRDYTGQERRSAAQINRDGDMKHLMDKIDAATDLEALGAVGREIKEALPSLPFAFRDPLHDRYAARKEEIEQGLAQ